MSWHFITGEYPPSPGGVSDYSCHVAEALALRGEAVTVCAPAAAGRSSGQEKRNGLRIEWLPDHYGWRGQRALSRFLAREPSGGTILLQYVPHAFGWKGINVPFCAWLARQRRHALWVMFHEVAYPLLPGQPWRHRLLARANLSMARLLARAAQRIFISTQSWSPLLESICGHAVPTQWMPIPSSFEGTGDGGPDKVLRESLLGQAGRGRVLLGHFGTFGSLITDLLGAIFPAVLARSPQTHLLLIGRGSREFADNLQQSAPVTRGRVTGIGEVEPAAVIGALRACDLLLQPYPDGVSTRRTSTMAGLAASCPIITQTGHLTESIWEESGAVRLLSDSDPVTWAQAVRDLLAMPPRHREQLGQTGKRLYQSRFSLDHTLRILRGTSAAHTDAMIHP